MLEIGGLFAIAASLVFGGVQLRQDRLIALAEQYQARTINTSDNFRALLQHHDVLAIVAKVRSGKELTEVEGDALRTLQSLGHMAYQSEYYRYRLGLTSDETWQISRDNLKIDMTRPGFRDAVRFPDPDYLRLLDEINAELGSAD